jgi:predicted transcriptional regulator
MSSTKEYRDKIYIRKDILLKLSKYGSLNQTALLSFCGLNLQKHKKILEEMESKGLIDRTEELWGTKKVTQFKATELGKKFCKMILEPYESMFPRKKKQITRKW